MPTHAAYCEEDVTTATAAIHQGEEVASMPITTTLYDLITAVQEAVEPWEEELVVPLVTHILRSYCVAGWPG